MPPRSSKDDFDWAYWLGILSAAAEVLLVDGTSHAARGTATAALAAFKDAWKSRDRVETGMVVTVPLACYHGRFGSPEGACPKPATHVLFFEQGDASTYCDDHGPFLGGAARLVVLARVDLNTSAPQHVSTSGPQHLRTSAPTEERR